MKPRPPLTRVVAGPMSDSLPEKVLQFGTGRLLRAFADYFIDRANKQGLFNGRIVVAQSTGRQRADTLRKQDGLYTLWVRGLRNGAPHETHAVLSSISRSFSATDSWPDILACARSHDLEIIISNTTEVGLTFDGGDHRSANPPRSFPGKLTAVLYERARAFDYDPGAGLVILPCELLEANGDLLRRLVCQVATAWELDHAFVRWVQESNTFCNTLVDRIVPGLPPAKERGAFESKVQYRDAMLTVAEEYRLWAIEGDAALTDRLAFTRADPGIIVTPDIAPYRIRKIRILNGGHTLSVPAGFLMGNNTVLGSMTHPLYGDYIENLLRREIGPTLEVDPKTVSPYIDEVLTRWRNPFLQHHLIDITLHGTSKMRVRVIPSLLRHYALFSRVPHRMAAGFAGYLLFMRGLTEEGSMVYGEFEGTRYPIHDTRARDFMAWWASGAGLIAARICKDASLWGADLTSLPGFADAVAQYLHLMMREGIPAAIAHAESVAS